MTFVKSLTAIAFGISLGLIQTTYAGNTQATPLSAISQATESASWYNCLTMEVWSPEKQAWCNRFMALQNMEYTLPDFGTITLAHGSYENSEQRFNVSLANREGWVDFGDLNGDGEDDAVVLLGVTSGASGQFTYLVPVLSSGDTMQSLTPVFLGDRVLVQAVTIQDGQITVEMITQGPGEPMCCPTLEVTQIYALQDTTLVQVGGDPVQQRPQVLPPGPPQSTAPTPVDTLVFLETPTHAVRIFERDRQPRINLYNRQTQVLELNAAPVTVDPTPEGNAYLYQGEFTVRVFAANDGTHSLEINGEQP